MAFGYVFRVLLRRDGSLLAVRGRWLQHSCIRLLRVLNTHIRTAGPTPQEGLLVSNHLGYLDILVLASLSPSIFVAKSEVKHWPIFGWFACLGGTLFVDRDRRTQVGELTQRFANCSRPRCAGNFVSRRYQFGWPSILPFKSALLEPAADGTRALSASFIEYRLKDGDAGQEVCYWRDMTFLPHLVNLLSKKRVEVCVRFSKINRCKRGPQRTGSSIAGGSFESEKHY